jgi:hypothetical protein
MVDPRRSGAVTVKPASGHQRAPLSEAAPLPPRALHHRALDVLFCASFAYFTVALGVEVWEGFIRHELGGLLFPAIALASFLAADFASGFVHWLADSYGSPETPLLGAKLVTPFREHHVDPLAITRHDFFEANGDNCLISHIVLVPAYVWLPGIESGWATGLALFVMLLGLGVLLTSIAHGWAHTAEPPRIVRALQRAGIILSREHHQQHHQGAHATHYCITTGWLNPLLDRTRFFRILERVFAFVGIRRST